MSSKNSRREAIKKMVLGSALVGLQPSSLALGSPGPEPYLLLKDHIHASVCYWCYQSIPLDDFCAAIRKLGLEAIDLLTPEQWDTAARHGLKVSMCYGGDLGIPRGWNDPRYHATMIRNYSENIPLAAKYGYRNIICFSGYRKGMDDETGMQNCIRGLKQLLPLAEKYRVNIVMELLNSKVDHPDYMCDHSAWGVELCKRIGSERFRLLYDIYHMQIMEGDIIRTIQENYPYFVHYHTGGVPGRKEIDDTQELYYPAVMRAILATGFQGHVAQEFIPTPKDKAGMLASLEKCVRICDV